MVIVHELKLIKAVANHLDQLTRATWEVLMSTIIQKWSHDSVLGFLYLHADDIEHTMMVSLDILQGWVLGESG